MKAKARAKLASDLPDDVLGVPIHRVLDTWVVDDLHGSRTYLAVTTEDGREVTLLRTDDGWYPTIVTAAR